MVDIEIETVGPEGALRYIAARYTQQGRRHNPGPIICIGKSIPFTRPCLAVRWLWLQVLLWDETLTPEQQAFLDDHTDCTPDPIPQILTNGTLTRPASMILALSQDGSPPLVYEFRKEDP